MHTFSRPAALLAFSLGTVASLPALAADELHYNQISLRAEASQEVARDLMIVTLYTDCLLYTSPSPRDGLLSRMPSSA